MATGTQVKNSLYILDGTLITPLTTNHNRCVRSPRVSRIERTTDHLAPATGPPVLAGHPGLGQVAVSVRSGA